MSNQSEYDGKEHKIKNKLIHFLASEIASALFFLLVGICLIAFPMHTMYFFTKIVFGLLLIFAGIYNIGEFLFGKSQFTVFHMFAGVVVLVLGCFMFLNPEVINGVLPQLLGGLVIVDSVWMVQASFRFYKSENQLWKIFLPAGLVCFALGIVFVLDPFPEVRQTILFGGIVFVLNGIADIVFFILMRKDQKKPAAGSEQERPSYIPETEKKKEKEPKEPKEHKFSFKNIFKGKTEKETHFGDALENTDAPADEQPSWQAQEGPSLTLTPEDTDIPQTPEGPQIPPAGNPEQGGEAE